MRRGKTRNPATTITRMPLIRQDGRPVAVGSGDVAPTGSITVDPAGALDGDGSSGSPLAVKVDGASVIINGSNQLEAPGAAGGITQLTGDVTAGPGSGSQAATIAANAVTTAKILNANVTTAKIADANVTYAKIQNVSAALRILARKTAGAGVVEEATIAEVLEFIAGSAQGDILIRNGTVWTRLGIGAAGTFLKSSGAGADPSWSALPSGVLVGQVIIGDAAIKTISSVPVQIVAAPGAGLFINTLTFSTIKSTAGGVYSANPSWSIRYDGLATDLCTAQSITITAADKRYHKYAMVQSNITNPPINTKLMVRGTVDVTGGNAANYVVAHVTYSLLVDGP